MGCAMEVIKIILFIFNLVFALSGLGLLIVGVLYKFQLENYTQYIDPHLSVAPTFLIIIGAIIFIIAFFGCCGAIRENHFMVTTYAILLLTIFLIEVAIGVYIYLRADGKDIDTTLKEEFSTVFKKYNKDPVAQESINFVQSNLHCCGIDGPTDYTLIFSEVSLPASCCKNENDKSCLIAIGSYWPDGCVTKIDKFKDDIAAILGITAISVALVEIVGIIFALCLANSIKNQERRVNV